jgi:hypothetical protein
MINLLNINFFYNTKFQHVNVKNAFIFYYMKALAFKG